MTRPHPMRARTAVRSRPTPPWRIWLLAGLALALASAFALPAFAAEADGSTRAEALIAFAATSSAGAAADRFGAPPVQADPVPTPRELRPDRLIVAGTMGIGFATVLVLALSMLDGAVRDRGFHGSRR